MDATFANRYWKGAKAIGKQVRNTGNQQWFSIIGVVGALRDGDAAEAPWPHMYFSLPQAGGNPLSLASRTSGPWAGVIANTRRASTEMEPSIPLDDVQSLSTIVDRTFATRRLTKLLLGGFALVGLILAVVGIYGVMSLHVANRGREVGIRLAVGAEPRRLIRLILGERAVLAGLGVAIGDVVPLVNSTQSRRSTVSGSLPAARRAGR
ncbi:MAG: FtsX-like permease family protein [Gemmatimonadota bacterium]